MTTAPCATSVLPKSESVLSDSYHALRPPSPSRVMHQIDISFESACKQLMDSGYLPSEEEAAAWTQDLDGGGSSSVGAADDNNTPSDGDDHEEQISETGVNFGTASTAQHSASATHTKTDTRTGSNPTNCHNTQTQSQAPRPPNRFMIYRSVFTRGLQRVVFRDDAGVRGGLKNGLKSAIIGLHWQTLSEAGQRPWVDAAVRVEREHGVRYPGYKYKPAKKGERKGRGKAKAKGGGEVKHAAKRRRKRSVVISTAASSRGGSVLRVWGASTLDDEDARGLNLNYLVSGDDDVDRDVTSAFSPAPSTTPQALELNESIHHPPSDAHYGGQYRLLRLSYDDDERERAREVSPAPVVINTRPRRATVHLPLDGDDRTASRRDLSETLSPTMVDRYTPYSAYHSYQLPFSDRGRGGGGESSTEPVSGNFTDNFDGHYKQEEEEGIGGLASSTSIVRSPASGLLSGPHGARMFVDHRLSATPKALAGLPLHLDVQHSPTTPRYGLATMPRHEAVTIARPREVEMTEHLSTHPNVITSTIPQSFVRAEYNTHRRETAYDITVAPESADREGQRRRHDPRHDPHHDNTSTTVRPADYRFSATPKALAGLPVHLDIQQSPVIPRHGLGTTPRHEVQAEATIPRRQHEVDEDDSIHTNTIASTIPQSFVRTYYADTHRRDPVYDVTSVPESADHEPEGQRRRHDYHDHNAIVRPGVDVGATGGTGQYSGNINNNPDLIIRSMRDNPTVRPRARTLLGSPRVGLVDNVMSGRVPPTPRLTYRRFGMDAYYFAGGHGGAV